jgi:hypothetical protein
MPAALGWAGRWFRWLVRRHPVALQICDAAEEIAGGISGSPIVADDGSAIGIVSTSAGPETSKSKAEQG